MSLNKKRRAERSPLFREQIKRTTEAAESALKQKGKEYEIYDQLLQCYNFIKGSISFYYAAQMEELRRMKKKVIKICTGAVLLAAAAAVIFNWLNPTVQTYEGKYAGVDLSSDVGEISRENTYAAYLLAYSDALCPDNTVSVDVTQYTSAEGAAVQDYQGRSNVLMTEEKSSVTWTVEISQAGMYTLEFLYCPVLSRGIDAERSLLINGQTPFRGADCQTFSRLWTDLEEEKGKTDNQGNEIRPTQVEVLSWTTKKVKDDFSGFEMEPYRFYLQEGSNTVTLEGISEPLAIAEMTICPVQQQITYEQYCQSQPAAGQTQSWMEIIQAEDATVRSDPSLYASYDRSSPTTQPYSIELTKLNMIGGTAWSTHGQWIEWNISVPEDGWYNIGFKARQNYSRGQSAIRALYVDGEIPFSEVNQLDFGYSSDWQFGVPGDENGEYRFYLTEGTHTVRMEVTLGSMGSTLRKMEDSVYRLNQIYRKFLVLMGRTPDRYRDYPIVESYPDIQAAMLLESQRLYQITDEIIEQSGGRSSYTGTIVVMANMLEEFSKDPDQIKKQLQIFRDNISALGTTAQNLRQSQLDIDYLVVKTTDAQWPEDSATALDSLWHEVRSFFVSFTKDYDSLGDVHEGTQVLEVWILTGRDQANILKTIIDDSFTPETGIAINLKLADSSAVLTAVAAGNGPDILISAGQGEPVNYALRNAAEDLTQFEDYEEVFSRFHESAYVPYLYEDGIYAVPETQNYNVLFYRKDILDELGLEVPQTWEDLENMLPVLQHKNMEVGVPDAINKSAADLSGFYAMMFQNGVELYNEHGSRAMLDEEGAIKAFEAYTAFYTNHDLPRDYNFVDRFRSGEMPVGIANFSMQNTLAVFAPELDGLWSFTLAPGTVQEDGSIDYSVLSNSTCSMMLKSEDETLKDTGWEFLKWWTSTEVQARFGREMECLLGSSARYATANVEAFSMLSWSSDELAILNEQRQWCKGNREVAGGYYTSQHVVNAVRKVINDQAVPRETLLDYNQTINDEIKKKRLEFGLE